MVIDLGFFERALEGARGELDHRFLDDVPDLGPATMENLSAWIWRKVSPICAGLVRVTVYRDSSGDVCRSEEHTSELQSLMRISYAVFCLKKKKYRILTTYRLLTIQT